MTYDGQSSGAEVRERSSKNQREIERKESRQICRRKKRDICPLSSSFHQQGRREGEREREKAQVLVVGLTTTPK